MGRAVSDDISVRTYTAVDAGTWNAFVAASKNGTFLHDRAFMEYHADRFEDCSLMFESDGKLVAVLPANRDGNVLVSHGGLTYGGFLTGVGMTAERMLEVVAALGDWMLRNALTSLIYKPVPHVFHRFPAEEDLYALQRAGARLSRSDLSSVVDLRRRIPFNTLRKRGVKKARKAGLSCAETEDFAAYWDMLAERLQERHDTRPTHSLEEIRLLQSRFPEKLRLFACHADAEGGPEMVAGIVIFDMGHAVHAQYIASSERGRALGALDLLVHELLEIIFADRDWFSFGISTTDAGRELNVGLARQKEMFGGRAVVFTHYTWDPHGDVQTRP